MFYYSLLKKRNTSFGLSEKNGRITYETTHNNVSFFTNEALYPIIVDFDYYQHFYKVKTNDIVVDAGANCGHLSMLFSKLVGPNGKVFAIEPDKFNIQKIKNNIDLNNDLPENILIEDILFWNKNGEIDFYEAGTVGSSAIWIPDAQHCVKKQSVTIDDWVESHKLERLDFIKMDIEGAEIEALEGCKKI
ncbi:FkbM family methyltransferase [Flavobacterium phycosphaerae]|uniref:FkbM family methyltransferase n=1 Tax=Flavobacterium phycosphaerae TaxID=2697515 RepID=UPI001F00CAF8|nr:FkbM family methyltransferase [Flavobacterium phycosphaerae]